VSQITGKQKLAAPSAQNTPIFSKKTHDFRRTAPIPPTTAVVSSHPQRTLLAKTAPPRALFPIPYSLFPVPYSPGPLSEVKQ
jgi:hypothetical protein